MNRSDFKQYYDQYFDPLRSYLYYRSGNQALATDLSQEVFLIVWQKQMRIFPEQTPAVFFKIAKDLFISHLRKQKVRELHLQTLKLDFSQNEAVQRMGFTDLQAQYERLLAAMPEKQRVVFLMNRMEGATYREIAARLNLSVKAIEKRMHLAISFLKQHLQSHER
ncbi:MAG: sigma-70 family RNA polymerase sigma factor [Bacteroidota bacterium]